MKILVTGAGGFLGRHVVMEAIHRGHCVLAMVRPNSEITHLTWRDDPAVEVVRTDLRARHGLVKVLCDMDAVLHCAAVKEGDFYTHMANTVVGTENLLKAMHTAGVNRIVLVSSFSVYDYLHKRSWSLLDEESPLERQSEHRDEYCQAKLLQERLVRDHAAQSECAFTIVRPGVIFGSGHLWTARIGIQLTPTRWIRIGAWAPLPLTYVQNCAEAVMTCCERDEAISQTFNIVDSYCPSQRRYARTLQRSMANHPQIGFLPWTVVRMVARLAWSVNQLAFRGRAKVPGILVPARLHARCRPLRFSNQKIRNTLAWEPRYGLNEALNRSGVRGE